MTFAPDGAIEDTIVVAPGSERYFKFQTSGNRIGVMLLNRPFGRSTQSAVFGDALWVGTQDEPEVRQYAADGRLTRIVRTGTELAPVTEQQVAAFIDDQVEGPEPDDERSAREDYEDMPVPETVPPYGSMQVDSDGSLWLQDTDTYVSPSGWWTVYAFRRRGDCAARGLQSSYLQCLPARCRSSQSPTASSTSVATFASSI